MENFMAMNLSGINPQSRLALGLMSIRQNIFEDKIYKKNRLYQDIQKVFLLNFRPKR
jgi:hypothetical protein